MIAAFADSHEEVRQAAIESLGDANDPAVVDALFGALADRSEEARIAAAWALGRLARRDSGLRARLQKMRGEGFDFAASNIALKIADADG